jgi:MFS family permease
VTGTRRRSAASLWRNRDWLLLWSGQLVSTLGTRVSVLAFPLLGLAVTDSPAQAGLITAARGIPSTLLAMPAGALVDRWDRKRTMLVCDLGRAAVLGSVAGALLGGSLTLVHLVVAALVEGGLSTFFALAESACLPRVVPPHQLATAAAADQASAASADMVGPAIGGVLFGLGPGIPFLADALSYLVSFASLLGMRTPFQEARQAPSGAVAVSLRREVVDGLRWVWRQPLVRFLALLHGGVNLCGFGYMLILIVVARQQGATPVETGLVLGAGGGAAVVGSVLVAPLVRVVGRGWVLVGSTWVLALTWLAYALAPTPAWLALANAVACAAIPPYMATQLGFRLASTPDALQGRVASVFRVLSYGLQPLSLLLTGVLLERTGAVTTVVVLFLPQVVLAVAATLQPALASRGQQQSAAVNERQAGVL